MENWQALALKKQKILTSFFSKKSQPDAEALGAVAE